MTGTTTDKITEETWHKHLEFIQNTITRMAQNSYLLKGWTVTLVAATFALSLSVASIWLVVIALIPTITFASLDAYYLRQERLFRKLYESVRQYPGNVAAFSMDTTPYQNQVDDVRTIMNTVSISRFYLPIGVVIIIAAVVAGIVILATG